MTSKTKVPMVTMAGTHFIQAGCTKRCSPSIGRYAEELSDPQASVLAAAKDVPDVAELDLLDPCAFPPAGPLAFRPPTFDRLAAVLRALLRSWIHHSKARTAFSCTVRGRRVMVATAGLVGM
jgi:hypothetical protein